MKFAAVITTLIISAFAAVFFSITSSAETGGEVCPYRVFYEENGQSLREYYAKSGDNYKPFSVLYLGGITSELHKKYMTAAENGEPLSVEIVFSGEDGGLYFYMTCEKKLGKLVRTAGAYTGGDYNIILAATAEPFEKDGEMLYAFTIYREGLDDELTGALEKAKSIIRTAKTCTVDVRSGDSFEDAYGHVGEYTAPVTDRLTSDISGLNIADIGSRSYKSRAVKPKITVKDVLYVLENGTDYTVTYKNNSAIGTASVTITGKGIYTGSVTRTFDIVPQRSALTATSTEKGIRLKWGRAKEAERYVIYVSYDDGKSYKKVRKVKADKNSCILDLPADKNLIFRIRSYKTVDGRKYYSELSDEAYVELPE